MKWGVRLENNSLGIRDPRHLGRTQEVVDFHTGSVQVLS